MLSHPAKRYWLVLFSNIVMILVAIYISLTNGVFDLSVQDVLKTLLRMDPVPEHDLVILDFRLPRIVIAALVGFGLGVAGATIQGISRNGLADPGILGINAGAGAMIVIFMLFFGGRRTAESDWLSILAMPLFGWAGGLGAALLIYLFARQNGRLDTQRLILVGIAAGAGFGAVSLYLSLKMNPQDFEMATVWLAGSIWNANWQYVVAMLPWMILLVPIIISKAYILDLFQLGEERAKGLGVSTEKEKNLLLLASIGIVSACVSVSGNIGFVGLIAPHIAKRLVGVHHQRVIPISGTIGMLLVVVSDFIAKTVFAPVELSVGIVIAIIGIPYFVYLLFKTKV
ncbi:iron ABC transporter permease [Geobacillus sp. 47C-IIb]|uniref:FecCD family ABC transporter permease n=2 Tax=Anoxybacillaceae TaxID=3120669 RepID=UPI00040CBF41|nr:MULTISPECIES: iron ABC transporter permease [Geobacillus]ARP41202.1 Iron(3+)-hydroxamate import system permease protein FhuG [Geobacillus thermodenitrificans]KQB94817.1 Iron-uptake system permease protein FeuC [Geobacillus sp. PA-3]MED0664536.1 iron ABC transporter permease [Geobacillus thermodenitrificans]MED3716926.1 iron ABC transporter permease [Geobacillus thermodenitrificans]MED4916373.1 iron ABC transporter permease [Geobacillus thermodenitrificans]